MTAKTIYALVPIEVDDAEVCWEFPFSDQEQPMAAVCGRECLYLRRLPFEMTQMGCALFNDTLGHRASGPARLGRCLKAQREASLKDTDRRIP